MRCDKLSVAAQGVEEELGGIEHLTQSRAGAWLVLMMMTVNVMHAGRRADQKQSKTLSLCLSLAMWEETGCFPSAGRKRTRGRSELEGSTVPVR